MTPIKSKINQLLDQGKNAAVEFKNAVISPDSIAKEIVAVNPIILKFMENLRYIDKLGRGLPMVWQTAKKNGKIVEFEEIGEEFLVRLFL